MSPGVAIDRVILWGFMASGKTAVGSRLAKRLGWKHIDLDEEIVLRAGKPIERIFSEDGEPAFRALEAEVSGELIGQRGAVISPGGGWVTIPGILETIPDRTLTVWLHVEANTVLKRLRSGRRAPTRPLLSAPDRAERVRTLLAQREALYRRADHTVRTDGRSLEGIVAEIAALAVPPPSLSQRRSEVSDG